MTFEKPGEHLFLLVIILKICSLFIVLPQRPCYAVVLKVMLPYSKALWIIQKEMHVDGGQARPTSYCALPYVRDH